MTKTYSREGNNMTDKFEVGDRVRRKSHFIIGRDEDLYHKKGTISETGVRMIKVIWDEPLSNGETIWNMPPKHWEKIDEKIKKWKGLI